MVKGEGGGEGGEGLELVIMLFSCMVYCLVFSFKWMNLRVYKQSKTINIYIIPTYDWKTYLKKLFKDITSISCKHHIRMTKDAIGVVYTKEYLDSEEISENILKNKSSPTGMPDVILRRISSRT